VQGGGGNDIIAGGTGADRLLGNGGGDQIVGGRGDDRILGGAGSDLLFGGRVSSERDSLLMAPDDGPDRLDCGGARDAASADPWDTVRGCESVSILPENRRGGRAG
jgi:Ca2+-binding RTX toxin-like protein